MALRDVVIIGAGHNGLVAAFYLAKAGLKPLVLERSTMVGGAAITDELFPGFKCSTLAHATGPLRPDIARKMRLRRFGLEMIEPEISTLSLGPEGQSLALYRDSARAAQEIDKVSPHDAQHFLEFEKTLKRMGEFIARLLRDAPPSLEAPGSGDLWRLLKTGRRFRGLGSKDMSRLLRWGPMAVADLVGEWFETEPLRATIAARGILGAALGPWSAGSAALLLLRAASDPHPVGRVAFPRGGMGSLTHAMALSAEKAGVHIRTGAEVASIEVKDGSVSTVVLRSGEEIPAKVAISSADPKRTFFGMIDPAHLEPDFLVKLGSYRCAGRMAKVNLALDTLPTFTALSSVDDAHMLGGRIHIGPEIDYLERAFDDSKYREFSKHPYLDVSIPSLHDSSLAPAGKHVMSVYAQYAPYELSSGDWEKQREALGDSVVKTLARYAPDLPNFILHRQVITPQDLEEKYALTGGHIFHGELALDQMYAMRPLLGWARYRTPIRGLYLCGNGTHPGTGLTGACGANAAREIFKDLRWSDLL